LVPIAVIVVITLISIVACHKIAVSRGASGVFWGTMGLLFGPFAIPFACFAKPKASGGVAGTDGLTDSK
jgi:energy-coupling factor transporter transmembrane protein EcfT